MARRQVILQNEAPYSVTTRSNNKDWFGLSNQICADIFSEVIEKAKKEYDFKTHLFLLMDNHYHWLLSTPQSNLSMGMRYINTEASKLMGRSTGRINHVFGARYSWCLIQDPYYFSNTVRYILQNPLRAGMCEKVSDYFWSTHTGMKSIEITECEHMSEFIPPAEHFDSWANQIPDSVFNSRMKRALSKTVFKFPRHPTTKRKTM